MIKSLNVNNAEMAEKILNVQIPAYKVEAEMINFHGIPQLKDTPGTIMNSKEKFLGFMLEDELAGFISYTENHIAIEICRLVVHPSHFRKGIARKLVAFVMMNMVKDKKAVVSTGAKNLPAKKLYKSFGFKEVKDIEVAQAVYITLLEKI
ncbi:GNAT family N-acetyltransferase [Metabacillus arenae]|uniref:GNAT family N-acetyltransferase n=1 Tax=Metabacillus arenae TaxID=2771434 RepID=A0A926RWP8_9BACI|nr:GNAT family N-acetyltransferase [Metabacillus arenae]MBD1381033.1 GNAT family N-acetyltransferase [Metabacillus arenae]